MKKVSAPKTVVHPMFWMTDDEAYQRLLPDGLMTDGSHPRRCVREGEGGSIRHNPLTHKGKKIMTAMKGQYGEKKGEQVFYASRNAGKIKGVERGKHS